MTTGPVKLRGAFVWDCPGCATLNTHEGVSLRKAEAAYAADFAREHFGEDMQADDFCTLPRMVVCRECRRTFDVQEPEPPVDQAEEWKRA